MKITFLIPPILVGKRATERVAGCTYTLYPVPNIYELTVAAVIEEMGHEVRYVESVLNKWDRHDFISFLKKDDSDIYSIWAVNLGKDNDLKSHSIIRSIKRDTPVIFMGPAPTYFTEEFVKDDFTYVVRGEPDYTTYDLVQSLEKGKDIAYVKGISYKKNNNVVNNLPRELIDNLDNLPFPARHLINRDKYCNPKLKDSPYTAVLTTRNCPYKCIYCVPSSLSFAREIEYKKFHNNKKPPIRSRSPENVRNELELLKKEGYKSISFQDDLFVWTEKRTFELCDALKETGFIWGCQSRPDKLTNNIVKKMADSGCKYVDIGVESFDQKVLDFIKKDIRVEDAIKGIRLLKEYGITAKINVLFGTSPIETTKTIDYTYEMIKKMDVDQVMFSIVCPFPGTDFYNMVKEKGWFINEDYMAVDVQKKAITSFPNLNNRQIEKAVFRGNLKFFLHPRFISKHITKFRTVRDFYSAAAALYKKLFA